jgi:hypothetical protein
VAKHRSGIESRDAERLPACIVGKPMKNKPDLHVLCSAALASHSTEKSGKKQPSGTSAREGRKSQLRHAPALKCLPCLMDGTILA